MTVLANQVQEALEGIFDPCSVAVGTPLDILSMGLVANLSVDDKGTVAIALLPTSPSCTLITSIMETVERRLRDIPGVSSVEVTLTNEALWTEARMSENARQALMSRRIRARATAPGEIVSVEKS